jgi:hypothetical protein
MPLFCEFCICILRGVVFGEVRTSLLYENFLVLILKLEFSGDGGQIRRLKLGVAAVLWGHPGTADSRVVPGSEADRNILTSFILLESTVKAWWVVGGGGGGIWILEFSRVFWIALTESWGL